MPILRVKEIRDMPTEDRQKRLAELQTELVRLRTMIKAGGSIENPGRVHDLRKAIARILTIENEPKPIKKEEKKKEKKKETREKRKKVEKKPKEDRKE